MKTKRWVEIENYIILKNATKIELKHLEPSPKTFR
jgi:hypothetical protein